MAKSLKQPKARRSDVSHDEHGEPEASTSAMRGTATPRTIGAFRVLRIGEHHYSYMRKHDGEDERTTFLVNLPTDTTEQHIRSIFKSAGAIESVQMWKPMSELKKADRHDGATAGKETAPAIVPMPPLDPRYPHRLLPTATSAHITFLDESSLQRALDLTHVDIWPDPFKKLVKARQKLALQEEASAGKKRKAMTASEAAAAAGESGTAPPLGLDYLIARHKALRPSLADVRAHADSVIANFAWHKAHPARKTKDGIEAVSVGPEGELLDADGFVIVQRGTGKYGRAVDGTQGGAGGVRIARTRPDDGNDGTADQPAKKKKKRMELEDFYRFQRREAKRQELANLRVKFQADQEKVKKLKAGRSFKPF